LQLAELATTLHRVNLLFAELQGGSTKVRASKKAAVGKAGSTAWAKGTGFGGAGSNTNAYSYNYSGQAAATAGKPSKEDATRNKATAKEAKEDGEMIELFASLSTVFRAVSNSGFPEKDGSKYNGAVGMLCLEHLLHSSELDGLLALLLRNDSLMDITTNRSDVYSALLQFLKALCSSGTLGVSVLIGLSPFRRGLLQLRRSKRNNSAGAVKAAAGAAGGHAKRKAAAAALDDQSAEDPDDERTAVVDVLEQLDKQCKVFVRCFLCRQA
jgi:hypothetical protein